MSDDNSVADAPRIDKIEDAMRARERFDKVLQDKFGKRMTIVFSDICGYTQFMDKRGDISGRAWVQKHHDMVLPLIENHNGNVVQVMGDGVMSSFNSPLDAIKTSVNIQEVLAEYNRTSDKADELHVSIGINTGDILVDTGHIAGDAVNVAAHIENIAETDQILISDSTYSEVRGCDDIICREHGSFQIKGKDHSCKLYRVVWHDEIVVTDQTPQIRSIDSALGKPLSKAKKVMQIEIATEGNQLKISAFEHQTSEVNTVRQYEEIPISMGKIEDRCREMTEMLNTCSREGRMTRGVGLKLREVGQIFRDELFSLDVKQRLDVSSADHLILNLDDRLVQVPWELLHDGNQFLCQRFNMGRLVKTRQTIAGVKTRLLERPLKMLILADPRGDLKNAYDEGLQIRDFMDRQNDLVNVSLRSENISSEYIQAKFRYFDVVHYAGHADYDANNPGESGWRLSDGVMTARTFRQMSGTAIMPALVFSNACQSARTTEWGIKTHFHDDIFGMANSLILAGVKHYVGTFWEILDEPSKCFARDFYKYLLTGHSTGEAMRLARMASINAYGEETIIWASYLLYGDPTFNYVEQIGDEKPAAQPPSHESQNDIIDMKTRAGDAVIDYDEVPKKRPALAFLITAAAALITVLVLWVYPGILNTNTTHQEQALVALYHTGQLDKAMQAAQNLSIKNDNARISYLIQGEIFLRKGELDKAQSAYQKAVSTLKGTERQKADALIGLGRVASIRQDKDDAMAYYTEATRTDPENSRGYLAQGILAIRKGNESTALAFLEKAHSLSPEDRTITALADETRQKIHLSENEAKRKRIDALVRELLEKADKTTPPQPTDGWTSQPLSLWLMDFHTKGVSPQEGQDILLRAGITDGLLQQGRVQIVERALLDKLLEELRLGSSQLVDQRAALTVGKLMAARLIISGSIVLWGPHIQISLKVIETETGRITAAVNNTSNSTVPVSVLSRNISDSLTQKIKESYPLQGRVGIIDAEGIDLNIGSDAGAILGQRFRILNKETIVEVIAVSPSKSKAKIIEGSDIIEKGMYVREI